MLKTRLFFFSSYRRLQSVPFPPHFFFSSFFANKKKRGKRGCLFLRGRIYYECTRIERESAAKEKRHCSASYSMGIVLTLSPFSRERGKKFFRPFSLSILGITEVKDQRKEEGKKKMDIRFFFFFSFVHFLSGSYQSFPFPPSFLSLRYPHKPLCGKKT